MADTEDIAAELRELGLLRDSVPADAKPLGGERVPTLTMFKPTYYVEINDSKDREHFERILQKMRERGLLEDDDDGPYGPQGTGSFTINGCIDDCDP